ncbi:MAG: NAD(P)-binding domain-containing protein, partial [Myxococcota bacterium]
TVVMADGSTLKARTIVLAIGASDHPLWPEWATANHPRIHHIFDPKCERWPSQAKKTVAIVGGGISAGQAALRLCKEGHRVRLVS